MNKITTINFDIEVYEYIKSKTQNLSRFVNKIIREKMETEEEKIDKLKQEIQSKEKEIKELEKKKELEQKRKEVKINNLTQEELREIKESIEILSKQGGEMYFEGRYNRYKNLFGEINKDEFRGLLKLFNNIN